jgi:hypothetical protein
MMLANHMRRPNNSTKKMPIGTNMPTFAEKLTRSYLNQSGFVAGEESQARHSQ